MFKPALAFVTGATSGIGKALCFLLADQGIPLIIVGRNETKLRELEKKLKLQVDVISVTADLLNKEDRRLAIKAIHQQVPELVINNAGVGLYGDALTYSTEDQMEVLELNGSAVLELTLEAARSLVSHGKRGVIMNVSSASAFQTFPSLAVYAASKAFVNQLSQSLDIEMRPHGVSVLAVCPGMVDTHFSHQAGAKPERKPRSHVMSAEFVGQEIWRQIQTGKPLRVIDWKYRLLTYLSFLLPKSWTAALVRKNILQRIHPRTIIKVFHDTRSH